MTAGQIGNLKMVGHSYMDVKAPDNALTPGRLQSALGLADGRVQNDAGSGSQARFHVGPLVHTNVACTIRVAVGSSLVPTFASSLGASCLHQYFSKSMAFGALDASAWDTATAAATSELCGVWLRVSGP
ncbi:MAG: hypothetical protein U0Q07_13980 [Acidimicrobiales bacterium]